MDTKPVLTSVLLMSLLILGSANYSMVEGQVPASSQPIFQLQFMTVPQKLVQETDASLLVYAVDNSGKPLPIRIANLLVTSSDPSVVTIKNISTSDSDNSVKVEIHAGRIGTATVTAAASGFQSSSTQLEVVGDAYKPEGLLVKAVPSSFAHFGPYKGYVSVQLVNFFGNPVPANEDITINLSSSDPSVVPLSKEMMIKRGENFLMQEFLVTGSGITLLQAEVPGKWRESVKITVSQPKTPLELKFYAAPQIAPAMRGQFIYGFVQLQDANGQLVKADKDISVNIISDSADIRGATGVIKKGTTSIMVKLTVSTDKPCSDTGVERAPNNSNFNPCIELVAVAKGFKSQSSLIELRKPVTRLDLNPDTRFDDPSYVKIDPVIFPNFISTDSDQVNIEPTVNMPVLADGTTKFIGVVQLMQFVDSNTDGIIDLTAVPVVPYVDLPVLIESDDDSMLEVRTTVVQKGMSSSLIEATVGYQAGSTEIASVAQFFGQTFTQLTLQGHSGASLTTEPLVPKIMSKSNFPFMVYFKDSQGMAAHSIDHLTLSISKSDQPEAEIGTSRTTSEILAIETGKMIKGSPYTILNAETKGKGTSTITIEGSVRDLIFSTSSTVTIGSQVPERLQLFVPSLILGNAEYTVPLQVLDKDGFPIKTLNNVEVMLVPSIANVVSVPESILIPRGQYYTTFSIGAKNDGSTEITALANNFQSTKIGVNVETPTLSVSLTPSKQIVDADEQFAVTLNSQYLNAPIRDLQVKWSSDKATLIEADRLTNERGSAKANFVMNELGTQFVITAEVSGPGYKASTATLNMQTEALPESGGLIGNQANSDKGIVDILVSNPYFFLLPAIGGIVFWLIKTERINLPLDELREKFRRSED